MAYSAIPDAIGWAISATDCQSQCQFTIVAALVCGTNTTAAMPCTGKTAQWTLSHNTVENHSIC